MWLIRQTNGGRALTLPTLNRTKLIKLLYLVDVESVQASGKPFTSLRCCSRTHKGVGSLRLIRIERLTGKIHRLGPAYPWDDAAPTEKEAVLHFFAPEMEEVLRDLEARKAQRAANGEPAPNPAATVSPATHRFLHREP